jgi:hypothetical protein
LCCFCRKIRTTTFLLFVFTETVLLLWITVTDKPLSLVGKAGSQVFILGTNFNRDDMSGEIVYHIAAQITKTNRQE